MRAFSLVELSIVLVILGLLTGGILAGQSLIRAAELRAVTTEYQRYVTAMQSFRDKYFGTPGDIRNATAFWGRTSSASWCTTNSSAAVTTPGTCDGNGNGRTDEGSSGSQTAEAYEFWNQLARAGMIEGSYTGISGTSNGYDAQIGTNIPASRLGLAGWGIRWLGDFGGDGWTYALNYGNTFQFGSKSSNDRPTGPVLKPEEAWNIDTKLDDGRPAYGKVIARSWNNACATGGATYSDLANSVYNLTNTTLQCALYFTQQH